MNKDDLKPQKIPDVEKAKYRDSSHPHTEGECKRCGLTRATCEMPDGDEWVKNCQKVEGNRHDFGVPEGEKKLRERWMRYAVVDDSFEDAGVRLNAERIFDFFKENTFSFFTETSLELEKLLPLHCNGKVELMKDPHLRKSDVVWLFKALEARKEDVLKGERRRIIATIREEERVKAEARKEGEMANFLEKALKQLENNVIDLALPQNIAAMSYHGEGAEYWAEGRNEGIKLAKNIINTYGK